MESGAVSKSKEGETEEERRTRKEKERAERRAREKAEGENRKSKRDETEEERRARKERERAERRAREKAREGNEAQAQETEEERQARKEKERAERRARERARESNEAQAQETEEERQARKEKERAERRARERARESNEAQAQETEEERQARKEKERAERRAREKARESNEAQAQETEEERQARKERERAERRARERAREGNEAQAQETEEERQARKERESARRPAEEDPAPPSRQASRRAELQRSEEAREREALERRERRRREREARKGLQPSSEAPAAVGKSAIGVAELQRQGYRGQFEKDLARATALRRLVDLDEVTVPLADMPPQSQYDMYIRNFGESGRAQEATQAPAEEDRADAEVQAERVRMRNRGAAVPLDLGLYPEQLADRPSTKAAAADGEGDDSGDERGGAASRTHVVDTEILANFLGRVFPVMRAVLDENDGDSSSAAGGGKSKSEMEFSTSYTTYAFEATRNRPVQKVLFDPCSPTYVATLHGTKNSDGPSKELDRYMSVIVIWNIYSASSPEKILVSSSLITSMCISPRRSYLVYAGGYDGSICVWDTREPERNHITAGRYQQNTFRLPSFSTSWQSGNHAAPIVSVLVAGYNTVVGVRKDENEQLVSLDANGETFFWVVHEKNQSKGVISDSENGLNMFSAVRLFLATYKNEDSSTNNVAKSEAFALDFAPADASHYVVACAEGVRHISRFGGVAAPSVFGPFSRFFENPVAVPTCVRYSTVDSRVLVVGYEDGTVRLYLHTDGTPQLTIPLGIHRITEIRGSGTDKWLSWVLDAAGTLYLLDHARKDKELPVFTQSLFKAETGLCTCFDLPLETKGDARLIVLGFEKGVIQLHTLSVLNHPPSSDRNEHWL